MKAILLSGEKAAGRAALVDDADYPLVAPYRWTVRESVIKPGWRPAGPYAVSGSVLMHKLITGYPMTDHINHDGLDNRRANLRPANKSQNNHNQRPQIGTASRYKGVTWHRSTRKWQAKIGVNGKRHYLGVFPTELGAALAYNAAAIELHGEFACLNVIEAAA